MGRPLLRRYTAKRSRRALAACRLPAPEAITHPEAVDTVVVDVVVLAGVLPFKVAT